MNQKSHSSLYDKLIWIVFGLFTLWWLYLTFVVRSNAHNSLNNLIFSGTYGVMSVIGGAVGLIASKKWGGSRSLVGRALLFFSLGLLAQEFGQVAYSVYSYLLGGEIPYPSVGDIGYFGSVLLYIYAGTQLASTSGVRYSLKDRSKKYIAILLPLMVLIASYAYFLRGYQFDFSSAKSSLAVLLDFGYPLGQAIYVAIALLTYLLSKRLLGGVMRNKILLILFALVVQYAADFSFLYANRADKFFPAGANDYLYLVAYTVMALALNSFRKNFNSGVNNNGPAPAASSPPKSDT